NFGVMARVLLTGESRFLSSCDFKELRVTFYNSYVSGLTTFFLQHSANRGTQKNFDAFKLKLFRFAGQDNHRISDCADLTSESLAVPNVIMLHLRVGVADHLYPLIGTAARRSPYRASGLVLWHFSNSVRCPSCVRYAVPRRTSVSETRCRRSPIQIQPCHMSGAARPVPHDRAP